MCQLGRERKGGQKEMNEGRQGRKEEREEDIYIVQDVMMKCKIFLLN